MMSKDDKIDNRERKSLKKTKIMKNIIKKIYKIMIKIKNNNNK